ncbi:MAG: phosphate ABC transporter permease subunit PstC [Prevotella sp.]|jgi:phosphate transport system permease protein|uniref:Phosphate transport system permease protein n=1 Tax=Segatella cerevisiae TaxID=2053716 RepID=A0ABT1BYX3_9BACT|nr:phosphate ABC transporter permease subunit PstC [Segatella cerevisiae]MCH3994322.1 phosphate ABC transporter permease subunit PstC [Prevotella sp.]MCI1247055.1 phosphate ABC transporter permease subunit PstC [Prevotella sp.]MCO6025428.1 phosphate ABC transporter permease subunit PstC [Segatella cerevisiae]
MKAFFEKVISGIITCSGFLTSIVIVLIIVFLFSEGFGLFSQKSIEDGYTLVVNKSNPVNELNADQINKVFDQDISNWKQLGGKDRPIKVFRFDDMLSYFSEKQLGKNYENAGKCINQLVETYPGLIGFVPKEFVQKDFKGKQLKDHHISFSETLFGKQWFPTATPAAQFGFLPLILGTIWVTFFAILFSLPFGLSVSIYLSEVASPKIRAFLKPIIELLNGIPSVVYGFFGLIVIVPLLQDIFHLPVGESGLAGSIVLAIMALPTIISVSEDAMQNCPREMREASLALGATQWQTIYKVVIPYSISGITSAIVLGIGRAFGETMAVLMVTGNAAVIPTSLTDPLRTIPATIAAELGEAPAGGPHYQSLFLLGIILFIMTMIVNWSVEYISSKNK